MYPVLGELLMWIDLTEASYWTLEFPSCRAMLQKQMPITSTVFLYIISHYMAITYMWHQQGASKVGAKGSLYETCNTPSEQACTCTCTCKIWEQCRCNATRCKHDKQQVTDCNWIQTEKSSGALLGQALPMQSLNETMTWLIKDRNI